MFPRKLVFLISFISIFLLCIPIYYGVTYANNKVNVFEKEISEITAEGEGKNPYVLTRMNHKNFKDFEIELKADEFNLSGNYDAKFTIAIKNANVKGGKIINEVSLQIALAANWIKFYQTSSSRTISANELYKESSNNNTQTFYINNLQPLTEKTNYFIPFPKPTAYILVKYTIKEDDGKLKNVAALLDYSYGDYDVIKGGYAA